MDYLIYHNCNCRLCLDIHSFKVTWYRAGRVRDTSSHPRSTVPPPRSTVPPPPAVRRPSAVADPRVADPFCSRPSRLACGRGSSPPRLVSHPAHRRCCSRGRPSRFVAVVPRPPLVAAVPRLPPSRPAAVAHAARRGLCCCIFFRGVRLCFWTPPRRPPLLCCAALFWLVFALCWLVCCCTGALPSLCSLV